MANGGVVFLGVLLLLSWIAQFLVCVWKLRVVWKDRFEYISVVLTPLKVTLLLGTAAWSFLQLTVAIVPWLTDVYSVWPSILMSILFDAFVCPLTIAILCLLLQTPVSQHLFPAPTKSSSALLAAVSSSSSSSPGEDSSRAARRGGGGAAPSTTQSRHIDPAVGQNNNSSFPSVLPGNSQLLADSGLASVVAAGEGASRHLRPSPSSPHRYTSTGLEDDYYAPDGGEVLQMDSAGRSGDLDTDGDAAMTGAMMSSTTSVRSLYVGNPTATRRSELELGEASPAVVPSSSGGAAHQQQGLGGMLSEGLANIQEYIAFAKFFVTDDEGADREANGGARLDGDLTSSSVAWELKARRLVAVRVRSILFVLLLYVGLSVALAIWELSQTVIACSMNASLESRACTTEVALQHVWLVSPRVFGFLQLFAMSILFFGMCYCGTQHYVSLGHAVSKATFRRTFVWLTASFGFRVFSLWLMMFTSVRIERVVVFVELLDQVTQKVFLWFVTVHMSTAANRQLSDATLARIRDFQRVTQQVQDYVWAMLTDLLRRMRERLRSIGASIRHSMVGKKVARAWRNATAAAAPPASSQPPPPPTTSFGMRTEQLEAGREMQDVVPSGETVVRRGEYPPPRPGYEA